MGESWCAPGVGPKSPFATGSDSGDGPLPHHAGGIAQYSGHRAPTVYPDRLEQRLLGLAPLRLGILDELAALVRDRNDADSLVSARPTMDQPVPLQRSERAGNAGAVHDHGTAQC